MFEKVDVKAINTIRTLSIDAVEAANSGHPGLPMGAAPMAYVLWSKFLKINPLTSREWTDRDRFVLSAGHGSAMLYSLLHLSGYKVSLDDLKQFRQWGSKTPGHPEVHHTDGVEATTGPLGQGIAMAVGMAMAEAHLAATYNKEDFPIVDHYTYGLCGDGDLMEGISHEACSLAGHLKLGKLIVLYDSNDISLDGPTDKSFTEDVGKRFEAYGWQHILVKDGNDLDAIYAAIETAKAEKDKPALIEVKTVIGYGSASQGTSKVHGSPLGKVDAENVKTFYGFDKDKKFDVSEEVYAHFRNELVVRGEKAQQEWEELFAGYKAAYPELAEQYVIAHSGELPEDWDKNLPTYEVGASAASRVTSKETIQELAKAIPFLWGGSADLSSSNNTMVAGVSDFEPSDFSGRNIWFGVREFAMAAAMNGIQLHGGTKVYGGTFFVFLDYLKAAVRLSAIQKVPVTYVLTHDSVAVGEDGPTHEPIEQLASLRCMPNVHVIRPADGNETVAAWKVAMQSKETPTVLVLSRQNLPVIPHTKELAEDGVAKGGYVLSKQQGDKPDGILIATGSEVHLAIQAQSSLWAQGKDVSVVSLPSFDLFERQSAEYKESVLPKDVKKRVSVEMGASFGWERYTGDQGDSISIDTFGASAPGETVIREYGFTVERVVSVFNAL
ncbi:transketolase [Trichococcus ilyis]|uniref:Transketolase n=1 Tax=Trichococcus ilyis TaxID=640938 RepID=A0A143YSF4_9LACT|nr:transketolase [Trichococcus ilyis]CZQ96310.1 transketolase signature 2 [Trichococcus ilyis]SEJ79142.1 transketolase [Trichococcus ilyis]